MKENMIVESLQQVDFSELDLPLVTIYEKPLDFPDAFVARVWDGKGPKPTNTMIKRDTIQEIREDIMAAGFETAFQRAEGDEPHIVETWMQIRQEIKVNRKETTAFLSNLLVHRLSGRGKYWAREVSLDYGTKDVKRVDFMQFEPEGVVHISEIEKGSFTSYEVKSCKADYNSGFGQN